MPLEAAVTEPFWMIPGPRDAAAHKFPEMFIDGPELFGLDLTHEK